MPTLPYTEEEKNQFHEKTLSIQVTNFANHFPDLMDEVKPEIIEYRECSTKMASLKKLIKQFEDSSQDHDDLLDQFYFELSLLQCAYNHANFLIKRKIEGGD